VEGCRGPPTRRFLTNGRKDGGYIFQTDVIAQGEDARISVESGRLSGLMLRRSDLTAQSSVLTLKAQLVGCLQGSNQHADVAVSVKPLPGAYPGSGRRVALPFNGLPDILIARRNYSTRKRA
jgi:hypothetical protein